jgi:hypothetical protein
MKEDSSKQSEPCPQFDGTHENYLQFRNALLAWLQTTSTSCIQMMGNRGGFELPADFLLAPRPPGIVAGQFVPRPFPGDRPALAPGAGAPALGMHNDLVSQWKDNMERYTQELNSTRKVTLMILKAVPSHCIAALEDPVFQFQNVTLQQIRAHLDEQFLILPPSLILTIRNSLCIPWSPAEPFSEFVGRQRKAQAILAANGQLVPEAFKFQWFEQCLIPSGVFATRIEIYKIALPNTLQQTFDTLAPVLLTYYLTLPSTITAKSAGYAASVLSGASAPHIAPGPHIAPSVHPDPVIAGILANLHSSNAAIQGIQSLLQGNTKTGGGIVNGGGSGNRKRGGGGGGGGGAAVSPPYCWTHGCIGHSSPACKNKKINHVDAATFTNQMKGKPA